LSFVAGVLLPFIFNALTQQQGVVLLVVVLAIFAACILYGEVYLSLPSGVAFGFGMLLTSFAAQNLWLAALATAAVTINLVRHSREDSSNNGVESEESSLIEPDLV
jgi:membrane protein implicated in regulation of membrane protease activity